MGLRPSRKKTQPNTTVKAENEVNNSDKNDDDVVSNNSGASSSSIAATEESSTSNNINNTLQREAWSARGKLLLNFHNAISRAINSPEMKQKCSEVASFMSETAEESSSMNHDYDDEATLIVQNKHKRDTDVRDKALAVGFFTFALLRGVPMIRNAVARRMSAARKYKFETTSSSSSAAATTTTQTVSHELQQQQQSTRQPGPSRLRKFLRLALDATISTAMTLLSGTFLFTPRQSAYIEDMSKLPLVAGKSVYAEVVCPPLLNEYKRTMEQFGGRWPVMTRGPSYSSSSSGAAAAASAAAATATANVDSPKLTQEDVSLNIIRTFAENCSRRILYERALQDEQNALNAVDNDHERKEKKLKLGTVFIPRPGVPEDIKVNIDEDVFFLDYDDASAVATTEEATTEACID